MLLRRAGHHGRGGGSLFRLGELEVHPACPFPPLIHVPGFEVRLTDLPAPSRSPPAWQRRRINAPWSETHSGQAPGDARMPGDRGAWPGHAPYVLGVATYVLSYADRFGCSALASQAHRGRGGALPGCGSTGSLPPLVDPRDPLQPRTSEPARCGRGDWRDRQRREVRVPVDTAHLGGSVAWSQTLGGPGRLGAVSGCRGHGKATDR